MFHFFIYIWLHVVVKMEGIVSIVTAALCNSQHVCVRGNEVHPNALYKLSVIDRICDGDKQDNLEMLTR